MDATVVGLVVGAVGTAAAIVAAWFSALAPSRKDLKRVEKNTQETSARVGNVETHIKSVDDRLREQYTREAVEAAAERVSILVSGEQDAELFRFVFVLKNTDVTLVSVDLLNEAGALFGSLRCRAGEPGTFGAIADNLLVGKWNSAGSVGANKVGLVLQANLLIQGREGHRRFAVYLTSRLIQLSGGSAAYRFRLEGACQGNWFHR
jgi:hypothetical protein